MAEPIEIANVSWDCQIWTRNGEGTDDSGISRMWAVVLLWTLFTLTSIVGNGFLIAVIHYERFTGDPQKRSLHNRLASHRLVFRRVHGGVKLE